MLLRIEDLDPDRSKQEYIDSIREDLEWLGLDWDEEMPRQSCRGEIYEHYFNCLPVYPCYCSRNELHAASAPHASDGRLLYAGTCRNLTPAQRAEKTRTPAWRVKVPQRDICFRDGICGEVRENLYMETGDFIVRRSDGVYAYQLAVVCDDALGGVTEVVRGSDLLDSTPRQIWLYETLGFTAPRFYHVPLLVAPDGRRLSKRERDLDSLHLRETVSARELIGHLGVLLGLLPEYMPACPQDLIPYFNWSRISPEPIIISGSF